MLSILIPTFNRWERLHKTVDSILPVRCRPLEVVVVDDGSTDGTELHVPEYAAKCESVGITFKYIRQANAGAAAARNTGLKNAAGKWIQWVDADDFVLADGVDALMKECQKPEAKDVVYGLVSQQLPDGTDIGFMGKRPSYLEADYFDYLWHTMGAIYRRDCLNRVGPWNTSIIMSDDWEFSCRARIAGCTYQFVEATVGIYAKHSDGTMTVSCFNEAKCFNNIETVFLIKNSLLNHNRYSRGMQQRCFNRALIHAIELKANGSGLAGIALRMCGEIGSPDLTEKLLFLAVRLLPGSFASKLAFHLIRFRGQ